MDKVLENKMRRVAARRGYRLEKSRLRDPRAIGFGGYMLVDQQNHVVLGGAGLNGFNYSASLEDVDKFFE